MIRINSRNNRVWNADGAENRNSFLVIVRSIGAGEGETITFVSRSQAGRGGKKVESSYLFLAASLHKSFLGRLKGKRAESNFSATWPPLFYHRSLKNLWEKGRTGTAALSVDYSVCCEGIARDSRDRVCVEPPSIEHLLAQLSRSLTSN